MNTHTPILESPPELAGAVEGSCSNPDTLRLLEASVVAGRIEALPLFTSATWCAYRSVVSRAFNKWDHVVLRGFPMTHDGATLLLASLLVGTSLRTYRDNRVVKRFRLSPWTTELSHTTCEGEFHTDLNTAQSPPAITAIQCLEPDPGSPVYGANRVARLTDLIHSLEQCDEVDTRRFLTEDTVTMLNERSSLSWSGRIVEDGAIRYHPETIRSAARKSGVSLGELEQLMTGVARAAMSVSEPFVLGRGDVLLLANRRTLHYRGECSVVFKHYPTDFSSRSVFVLHALDERQRV